jgi:hypothetical protein
MADRPQGEEDRNMTSISKFGLVALTAVAFVGFTSAPAVAQELCINSPAISLTDQTTDNEEALQRIQSLGNRCVTQRATGEQVTRADIIQFLQSNPDNRDVDYGEIARQLDIEN